MEIIGNALELRAFDRMEEDIRLIGYFKSEESERECIFVKLVFFFSLNTPHRLVRWICEGLSVAHALHYNMDF